MTRIALFAGPGHATGPSPRKNRSPGSALVRKAQDAAQGLFTALAVVTGVSSDQRFAGLTEDMRGNMSPRARRLMRADY